MAESTDAEFEGEEVVVVVDTVLAGDRLDGFFVAWPDRTTP